MSQYPPGDDISDINLVNTHSHCEVASVPWMLINNRFIYGAMYIASESRMTMKVVSVCYTSQFGPVSTFYSR